MKRNTPPHMKLTLPDGSRLTAVAFAQEDYPGISLYLQKQGGPVELICFAEYNPERDGQVCIGAYRSDEADTAYYQPYRAESSREDQDGPKIKAYCRSLRHLQNRAGRALSIPLCPVREMLRPPGGYSPQSSGPVPHGETPGADAKDVVIHYCEVYTGPDSRMPLVRLLPEGEDHHCPFLVRGKCRIHEAKPTVCAMYPIGRALRVDRGTGSEERPGIDYLFDPPGCGDQSETHTVREWLGSFHIPVDDPFFLEWQQGAKFLCESFRELEQASEIATAVLVRPMVYQRLYLDYFLRGEFLPQFRKNMEAVRHFVAGLREKVEAES